MVSVSLQVGTPALHLNFLPSNLFTRLHFSICAAMSPFSHHHEGRLPLHACVFRLDDKKGFIELQSATSFNPFWLDKEIF